MKGRLKRLAVTAMLALGSVGAVQVAQTSPALAASWVKPVQGTLGTQTAPWGYTGPGGHNGVDLMATKWTPIYAVHAGRVEQVMRDAHLNGQPYSCDVDGSPSVQGYGWYVGIYHSDDRTGTLYCHMVQQPAVWIGQTVSTGHLIGYVGSSGNSSTPHLLFQAHLGTTTDENNTTNPVTCMAARGVDLDSGPTAQYVSAHYLSDWGNDQAFADNGVSIPTC